MNTVKSPVDFEHPLAIKIRKQIVQALSEFNMFENGDKVMVCVSGGKDSSILLALLTEIQKRAEIDFTIEAAILDQKQPGFDATAFKTWIESLGVRLHVVERDTYSIVKEKVQGTTYCSLCSRLRRAILYDYAHAHGFTKLALGHHRDDVVHTALLNLFYIGTLGAMPPKLKSDDGRNILVRPLTYVSERDIEALADVWKFPIIPCNLCGSQDGLKRVRIKKLVRDLEKEIPNIYSSIQTALGNVKPSQLMDHEIWDFRGLKPEVPSEPQDALPLDQSNDESRV
ncbi:tRNA 2-thiocytidine biosynthesis protein TtcA [Bdellovibrio bacteriovorus]|uniref:tRNA 2-thiocytidine biosynthesis protein TtcA n=1 Tax=Bdellovibrio bacteriovorus TaxID=959 RepID=A0A150WJT3_BDEBC|nr:tRNA 2-thiocytidine(32) synthetase TtcA [Bdellovibrio bacteriovorus]KYG63883.1 tRNA 2-thiocytidine biosynthesis protein TtcA [Bdellovibrio bacteriovorus]